MDRVLETVSEPGRELPVHDGFDVVVAGGGIAGIAAAVAAVRNGVSVCILEKAFSLGGLATLGNVTHWLPLCDGRGRQLIAGLAEELLKLSVADLDRDFQGAGYVRIPTCWQAGGDVDERRCTRYQARFNPVSYLLALERLVLESGVTLLYDTRVCDVVRKGALLTHLVIENKSGRSAVRCRTVIDATGDADLCHLAGEVTESLDTNVLAGWSTFLTRNGIHLSPLSRAFSSEATRESAKGPFFRGDDAREVTAQVVETRKLILDRLEELRSRESDRGLQVVSVPSIPCFRMTRRLVSSFSLGAAHVHQWFDDTIGLTGDWRKSGPVYALPWRTLLGTRTHNLLTAGRCISADTTVWDVTRAIPTCAITGTAAGTGAALAVRAHDGDAHALPIASIRKQMIAQGNLLSPNLVKPV